MNCAEACRGGGRGAIGCTAIPVRVHYKDVVVGKYFEDLLTEEVLLVALKTVKALDDAHRMQCTNYLNATGLQLCLLPNFDNPRPEIKRVVHGLWTML